MYLEKKGMELNMTMDDLHYLYSDEELDCELYYRFDGDNGYEIYAEKDGTNCYIYKATQLRSSGYFEAYMNGEFITYDELEYLAYDYIRSDEVELDF